MTTYPALVAKLGFLHSLLRELAAADAHQGEHTIAYTASDGAQCTVHVHIDGTDMMMTETPGPGWVSVDASAKSDDTV